jgi:lipoprotein-anchoring transpeptidase ErfK/SrfK
MHDEASLSPLETGMRRLAILCFPALLCATSAPAWAASDGVIVFAPLEAQASESASVDAVPVPAPTRGRYGGGFIEALLTGGALQQPQTAGSSASEPADVEGEPDPQFRRQEVDYTGPEEPGTIVVDTPDRFLFLVEPHGKALRYGIGVGRPGFEWSGVKRISRKSEWPDWTPPTQMLLRRPDLPRHMAGGPDNPLGARALYLGSSLYRIHGTNEPSTIGHNVSSGCIRMMNEDVIDLYDRVPVGAKVIVL